MERLVVTGVRFAPDGRQDSFLLGSVDTAVNAWITQPVAVPVIEVVDALMQGDLVNTLFPTPVGRTPGPLLRVVALQDGVENVEVDGAPQEGQTVADLPRF